MEKNLLARIEEVAKEACMQYGVALYDVEIKNAARGMIVLVYITKVSGVTVGECQRVSRYMSEILDEEELINDRYFLEVSSPGLERELKLKKHYVSAIGEQVKLTFQALGKNITKTGTLKEVLPDSINIEFDGEECSVLFSDIKKAKTHFELKKN